MSNLALLKKVTFVAGQFCHGKVIYDEFEDSVKINMCHAMSLKR